MSNTEFTHTTAFNHYFTVLTGVTSVVSGTTAIGSRNAVVSIIYTIATYVSVSAYTFAAGTGAMGTIYITVYVGAIAITFTFITSTINIKISETTRATNRQDTVTIGTSTTGIGVTCAAGTDPSTTPATHGNETPTTAEVTGAEVFTVTHSNAAETVSHPETKVTGETTFTEYSIPMTITGTLTTTTITGVIIITK
uniref:NADH dehydrogenase subunit 6 n=1 Tax=Magnusiomyces fungicola TaxID=1734004 RepID=UPI001BEE0105|nr:NADH dehydrogenase subunit 6 [Saprochaete fungicola]QUV75097.1 NADH dehydrogenase subunit 6 [Saprochaete fungicola]